jgi:quercetin dioxygenase-like cupin family protein
MNLLDSKNLKWRRHTEGDNFDYPVDYSDAVLDAREDGRLELLVKWEPNCYCHFHRHTADTTSLVLQGELRVTDIDLVSGQELGTRIRTVGDFAHKEPGDVYMEQAGPDDALVLFSIYDTEAEGKLAQALTKQGKVISTSTIERIFRRLDSQ